MSSDPLALFDVLEENEPLILPPVDASTVWATLQDAAYRDQVVSLSLHSLMAVPVRSDGTAIGSLAVGRGESLSAGFHAHFVKPVAPEVLLEYIDDSLVDRPL